MSFKNFFSLILICTTVNSFAQSSLIRNFEISAMPIENSDSCVLSAGVAYLKLESISSVSITLFADTSTSQMWARTFTVNNSSDINTLILDDGLYNYIPLGNFLCNRYRSKLRILSALGATLDEKEFE